jgi:hypothetical protein
MTVPFVRVQTGLRIGSGSAGSINYPPQVNQVPARHDIRSSA